LTSNRVYTEKLIIDALEEVVLQLFRFSQRTREVKVDREEREPAQRKKKDLSEEGGKTKRQECDDGREVRRRERDLIYNRIPRASWPGPAGEKVRQIGTGAIGRYSGPSGA